MLQALSIVFVLSTLPCEAAVSTPSFEAILDASQQMTSATDYDRKFLDELKSCWSTFDPEYVTTHERLWEGFLNYSNTSGTPSDIWLPGSTPDPAKKTGCLVRPGRQPYMEKNYTVIGGALNVSICEPCNFVSNFAYYRLATRFCERERVKSWNLPADIKKAMVRQASNSGAGSAFMHGSETEVGHLLDTRGEFVLATLSHQAAIAALPAPWNNSSILNSFSKTPVMTGVDMTEYYSQMFTTQPVAEWTQSASKLPYDVSKPIAMTVASLFSLILPPASVEMLLKFIVDVLKNAPSIDPTALIKFLDEDYLPAFRNATSHIKLGELKKMEVAKKGIGAFTKFINSLFYQEQIIPWKPLLTPRANKIGAAIMPKVNVLADWLTGFDQGGDEEVKKCGNETYPGAGWCRPLIPHAKWHEQTANAFYDMLSLGEYLAEIYKSQEWRLSLDDRLGETEALSFLDDDVSSPLQSDKPSSWPPPVDQAPVPEPFRICFWRALCGFLAILLVISLVIVLQLFQELKRLQASREVGGALKEGLL